jgi:hypothetical protein
VRRGGAKSGRDSAGDAGALYMAAHRGSAANPRRDSRIGTLAARPGLPGNEVRPLVHGAAYFADLAAEVRKLRAGDLQLFTDWRGDAHERLAGDGCAVAEICATPHGAAYWSGPWCGDRIWTISSSASGENRHLGEDIEAAAGKCLPDMRVRPGGSHHQKFAVLRHNGRPEENVAFVDYSCGPGPCQPG